MKSVSGYGCSRATYRGAQVIHAYRRDGAASGLSAQVSLAFPGVTHTEINPQDASSPITVIDIQLGRKAG